MVYHIDTLIMASSTVARARALRRREVIEMAKSNKEVTSAKAASAAAKVLSNPKSSKAAKSAAASALTQRPNRKK